MGWKIIEKPTAVAAAPGWYVVHLWLMADDDQGPAYADAVLRATPDQVQIHHEPVVAWRIDFTKAGEAAQGTAERLDVWPGQDTVTPLTLTTQRRVWADVVLKTPDGDYTSPSFGDFKDARDAAAMFLNTERRRLGLPPRRGSGAE